MEENKAIMEMYRKTAELKACLLSWDCVLGWVRVRLCMMLRDC